MAYDEFCGVCNAGGIRIDNIMPVRAMLRRVGDGKVVSVMPENIKVDMSKSIRGGGFHSSAY